MTEILIKKENGSIAYFEVRGHSGYADEGYDIVCASVSSVVWTTVNGLENVLHLSPDYSERDGFVSCKINCKNDAERKNADILLFSMESFFAELAKQYPEFITKTEV